MPVLHPENLLRWDEESASEAVELASSIELHLAKVRKLQSEGVELLEKWNALVTESGPTPVLLPKEGLGQNQ